MIATVFSEAVQSSRNLMSTGKTTALACSAALSTQSQWESALDEVITGARGPLGSAPDVAVIFISTHHADAAEQIATDVTQRLSPAMVIGCTGEAIAGGDREIEEEPAISLWVGRWPQVEVTPMHLHFERGPEGAAIEGWPDSLHGEWSTNDFMIVLADPFSFPADYLLERMNEDRPKIAILGGMASGGTVPGENRLFLNGKSITEGAVALHISGPVRLKTVVSQGCRPIGRPLVVTRAERNVLYELGGKPAFLQLREIFETLPTSEQRLVQTALHIGRVVSEYKERFEHGDFLIRNVMGIDASSGAIAIGDYLRPGQTIQFHIRDEEAADAELKQLLASARNSYRSAPLGSLLFTCNGRGTRMFSKPHHDARAVQAALGAIPLAGFFAQGELGPIGHENFMHGFTASIGLFYSDELATPR
jgi:small ligand-binding sensory domain FIST